MKDRIGQSSKKKKPAEQGASSVTGVPKPDSFAGYSGGGKQPNSKLPLIIGAVVVLVIVIAVAVWLLVGNRGTGTGGGTAHVEPSVEYPTNTAGLSQQEQDLQQVLQSAKEQLAPTMTQLVDLIAINELTGTLESDGDGVNANIVAALPEESLSAQAAEFQASTNDDTIGWIQIPNTNVDYPVVYKAGVENYAYYESLGYDKQYSKDGVIWADYECTFPELSQNTTLYGHNWYNIYTPRTLENMQSNDLMFSLVMSYHYTDFAQQNPFIYFSTTEQDYVFQVFAAFYTDLSFGYNFANMTQEQTQQVIAEAKAKSRQNYNVSVTSEDKILTLSTCTRMYGNTNNQRFVVMAKLVPTGTRSLALKRDMTETLTIASSTNSDTLIKMAFTDLVFILSSCKISLIFDLAATAYTVTRKLRKINPCMRKARSVFVPLLSRFCPAPFENGRRT